VGPGATEVAVQRQPRLVGRRLGDRKRDPDDGIGTQPALVVRPVEVDHRLIDPPLVEGIETLERFRDLGLHRGHRPEHALAAVRLPAIAPLDGLEGTGRRPRRHGGSPVGARMEGRLHLDGRVAPRVEDLAGDQLVDGAHGFPVRSWRPPASALGGCVPVAPVAPALPL
jgi:hypothetical protein